MENVLSNLVHLYYPSENLTIDQQLLGFKGESPFEIYMSSKPVKYGIKIVMMNDSRTFLMITAMRDVGKLLCFNSLCLN